MRRGDYTKGEALQFHGLCSIDYYRLGVASLRHNLGNLHIEIFSDDEQSAIDLQCHLDNSSCAVYDQSATDLEIICYMSTASGYVLSNSTFGWWASYLNQSPKIPTICPDPWFSNQQISSVDLTPSHWITLPR